MPICPEPPSANNGRGSRVFSTSVIHLTIQASACRFLSESSVHAHCGFADQNLNSAFWRKSMVFTTGRYRNTWLAKVTGIKKERTGMINGTEFVPHWRRIFAHYMIFVYAVKTAPSEITYTLLCTRNEHRHRFSVQNSEQKFRIKI